MNSVIDISAGAIPTAAEPADSFGASALRKLRSPGFVALCDQGIVSLTNFATGVIVGRACGKAELGVYTLALTLITFSGEFSTSLITTPYAVFAPQLAPARRIRYAGSVLIHQIALAAVFALAMVVAAAFGTWQKLMSPAVTEIVLLTAAFVFMVSLREFVRRISFAELRMGSALAVDLIASLAQIGGMLLLLRFSTLSATRTYTLLGISSGVVAVAWLLKWRSGFRVNKSLCLRDMKRNWDFSRWVLASGLLWGGTGYVYPWILTTFHGTTATGIWAACSAISSLGNPVLLGLGNYVGPGISHVYAASGARAMERYVHRSTLIFLALLLPFVLVLGIWGVRMVTGIYGNSYANTGSVVFVLALNMLVSALSFPYSRGLFTLNCARADMLVNVVTVVLLFTVGILAVKYYAAPGAAMAMFVSTAITAILRAGVFIREARRHA